MKCSKSRFNFILLSLLTCAGLATPAFATPDSDNSIRAADFEGNVNNGGSRVINGDVTATDDLQDFRQFLLTGRANVRFIGEGVAPNGGRTDLLLIRDFNNNGVVDSGDIIAKSSGSFSHSFTRKNLNPGNYFILVRSAQLSADKVKYKVTIDARV